MSKILFLLLIYDASWFLLKTLFCRDQNPIRWFLYGIVNFVNENMRKKVEQKHARLINDSDAWLRKANALYSAAKDLWEIPLGGDDSEDPISKHQDVALLLMGYCLESALKGIFILKGNRGINKEKLSGDINTHDLTKLCELIGFDPGDEHEKLLVERLSQFTVWKGRYPAPKSSNNLRYIFTSDSLMKIFGGSTENFNRFDSIFRKLSEKIDNLKDNG